MPRSLNAPASATDTSVVGVRDEPRRGLDQGDLDAEVSEDRGELAAGVRATDDGRRRRQRRDAAQILVGQRELGSRDRQPPGVTADGDDEGVSHELAPVRDPDRMRVDERGTPDLVEQLDPAAAQRVRESLLIVHVVGDAPRACERRGDVKLRAGASQAETLPGLRVAHQPRSAGQRPNGRRAFVEAGASDLALPPPA